MTRTSSRSIFISLGLLASVAWPCHAATVQVAGWPFIDIPTSSAPPSWMGDDPVVGRLTCPSLTRFDLNSGESEGLILKDIAESAGKRQSWELNVRQGIHWWSGPEVSARDIASFIELTLDDLVKRRGHGQWNAPARTITADADTVRVSWDMAPPFGPWILNGAPLWRPSPSGSALPWECAGLYKITALGDPLRLDPARKTDATPSIQITSTWNPKAAIRFRFPANMDTGDPRSMDEPSCRNDLSLPVFVALSWNPASPLAGNPSLRRLFAEITPRGELIRAGAAHLGDLASAPIPRYHPGYNKDIDVRPFDLTRTANALDKLGYRRARPNAPRSTPNGTPMTLLIRASDDAPSLPRKVISDAFASVGIALRFKANAGDNADGSLDSFVVPWTLFDPADLFSPSAAPQNPWWSANTAEALTSRVSAFSLALTRRRPDLNALRHIHRMIADDERVTILMQQRVCIESRAARPPTADYRDPDWFRAALRAIPN